MRALLGSPSRPLLAGWALGAPADESSVAQCVWLTVPQRDGGRNHRSLPVHRPAGHVLLEGGNEAGMALSEHSSGQMQRKKPEAGEMGRRWPPARTIALSDCSSRHPRQALGRIELRKQDLRLCCCAPLFLLLFLRCHPERSEGPQQSFTLLRRSKVTLAKGPSCFEFVHRRNN